jgi:hypothetical protein
VTPPPPSETCEPALLVQNVDTTLTPLSELAGAAERGWGKPLPKGWDLMLVPPGYIADLRAKSAAGTLCYVEERTGENEPRVAVVIPFSTMETAEHFVRRVGLKPARSALNGEETK